MLLRSSCPPLSHKGMVDSEMVSYITFHLHGWLVGWLAYCCTTWMQRHGMHQMLNGGRA